MNSVNAKGDTPMNSNIKYKAFILGIIVILALTTLLAACTNEDTTGNKSNEIIFDTDIVISKHIDDVVDYCVSFINGKHTINQVLDDNTWSYSEDENVYYITAYSNEENAYNLMLKLSDKDINLERSIDYSKDSLTVIHVLNDIEHATIDNPTALEFEEFVGAHNVIAASTDMAVNRFFIDTLAKTIAHHSSIESFINKFVWKENKGDNTYEFKMRFDDNHSYLVSLNILCNKTDRAIDYKKDEVIIKDILTGDELMNPSVSEFLILMQEVQRDIEPDKYKFDEIILESFMHYLDGSTKLNQFVDQFNFELKDGVYTKTICSVTHEYNISISQNSGGTNDYLDYECVDIVLECVSEGWIIKNPTRDNVEGIYETYQKLQSDLRLDEELSTVVPRYHNTERMSLADTDILNDLMQLIVGELKINDVIKKYPFFSVDRAEYINFYNDYDEYYLKIKAYMYERILDYGCCEIEIKNIENGWTIVNPTLTEIKENILKPHKAGKPAPKTAEDLVLQKENYIDVYMVNSFRKRIIIDDKLAEQLVSKLKNPESKIVLKEYKDTEDEYNSCGIELYLEDMGYDYPVPMWKNNKDIKAIGWYSEEVPVSSLVYDKIIELVESSTDWHQVAITEIYDIISAELYYGDMLIGKTNDKEDMKKLNELFSTTMNMNGGTKCPFGANLILKRKDGQKIEVLLATDSCNVMVIGTSDYYMYVNDDYDESDESQKELLNIFGYDSFFDIDKK